MDLICMAGNDEIEYNRQVKQIKQMKILSSIMQKVKNKKNSGANYKNELLTIEIQGFFCGMTALKLFLQKQLCVADHSEISLMIT